MFERIRSWFGRRRSAPPPAPEPAPDRWPTPGSVPAPSAGGWPGQDEGPHAPLPPTRPQRGAPQPRPAGLQVAADGAYDRSELERFAVSRLPQVEPRVVRDVLDVFDEHLHLRGIADAPYQPLRFYTPDTVLTGEVVDGAEVAADAARFLDIDPVVAEQVLDVEHEYLDAKGLLG